MKTLLIVTLTLVGFTAPTFAQTVWTGATDNDFHTSGNWSGGLPDTSTNSGSIGSGTLVISANVNANITQTAGTVTVSGGARRFDSGTWNLQGGSLDVNSGSVWVVSGGNFIANGGSLTNTAAATSEILRIEDGSLEILSGSQNLSGGGVAHRSGNVLIDSASLTTTGTYSFAINGAVNPILTLQNGAILDVGLLSYGANPSTGYGLISFDGTLSSLVADTWNTGRKTEWNINFNSSASGSSFTIDSGYLTESEWQTQWTNGKLTVDSTNAGNFSDYFSVNNGILTFSAVPEPSTYALLLGTGLFSLWLLRRPLPTR